MNVRISGSLASAAILAVALAGCATNTPQSGPSFFVTSQGGGKGAEKAAKGGEAKGAKAQAKGAEKAAPKKAAKK